MSSPVVLITGALTGIGRAAAVIFAQEGARVVVSGRRDKQGQELVAELQGLGAEAIFVRSDVRKDEDVRNLVDQTVVRFGRLDIAVNNAGTEGSPGLVTDQTAESYAATFDTNVLGTLLSMKHELRVMLPQGSGSIVNVSSAYGSVGAAGASVYVASKHAVEGLTKSAALEVAGTGIRVNVVAPGTTDTGYAHTLHQHRSKQSGTRLDGASEASRSTRGDRSCDRLCRFGKCVVHDWCLHPSGWRDDRGLILGAPRLREVRG
jgi:NAD(P)-dependent dehydrogenase (short-subunit alcohol dehydrogenase family)